MPTPALLFILTDDEIQNNPFLTDEKTCPFYHLISEKFFDGKNNIKQIHSKKILVSENIRQQWYEAYHGDFMDVIESIAHFGPTIDKELPNNSVKILRGAFDVYNPDGCITVLLDLPATEGGGSNG